MWCLKKNNKPPWKEINLHKPMKKKQTPPWKEINLHKPMKKKQTPKTLSNRETRNTENQACLQNKKRNQTSSLQKKKTNKILKTRKLILLKQRIPLRRETRKVVPFWKRMAPRR